MAKDISNSEYEEMIAARDKKIEDLAKQVKDLKTEIAILERDGWAVDKCGDDDWD